MVHSYGPKQVFIKGLHGCYIKGWFISELKDCVMLLYQSKVVFLFQDLQFFLEFFFSYFFFRVGFGLVV